MEIQFVELHFSRQPRYDYAALKSRAEAILGTEIDSSDLPDGTGPYLLFHKQDQARYAEGKLPGETVLLAADMPIDIKGYTGEIQQSWRFRECEEVLRNSRHTLSVTEMMSGHLTPQERIRQFHGVLQAAIELTEPDAVVFRHSQQVVRPDDYLAHVRDPEIVRAGSLNIRFFNIAQAQGDYIMDTLGLTAIGLHDLQCHFRGLDTNDVAGILYKTALYIFENGAVIESGSTIEGIDAGSKWLCQMENALVPPARELLDLNPGPPYAAGRE